MWFLNADLDIAFSSAYPSSYAINVAAQSGYQFALQDVGEDATDSDVGPNGRSATVVLTST